MYGLYLYKEIISQNDDVIYLSIEMKDYTGEAIEIDALGDKNLTITLDNQNGEIFTPIIKSSVSLSLIDTGQIDYALFYTTDSTKYRLGIKINDVTQWTGYLTPDSFTESLQFRGSISLVFRDNLGLLGEIDYNLTEGYTTINDFILAAFDEISLGMDYEYKSNKYTGTIKIEDLVFDSQIKDKTWLDILTELLSSLGLQMRYVGNNTIRVFDVGDLRTLGGMATAMNFMFYERSGLREILPAWRELGVTQDYQLKGEVFEEDTSEGLSSPFSYTYTIPDRSPLYWKGTQQATLYNYDSVKLTSEAKTINPDEWGVSNKNIYITGCTTKTNNGVVFSQFIDRLDSGLEIKVTLPNVVCFPIEGEYYDVLTGTTTVAFGLEPDIMSSSANSYSVNYRFNVFYITTDNTYVLRGNWAIYNDEASWIEFTTSKNGYRTRDAINWPFPFDSSNVTLKDETFTIDVMTLPAEAGELRVKIYEWYIPEATPRSLIDIKSIAVIKEFTIQAKGELKENNEEKYQISSANFKKTIDFSFGELPEKSGGISMYRGGLFANTEFYPPVFNFNRGGDNYVLSKLVSGELIHHFKSVQDRLSGDILPTSLIVFDSYFQYNSKDYLLNYGSLNLMTGYMRVELIEVRDYDDPFIPTTTTTSTSTTTSTTSTTTANVGYLTIDWSSSQGDVSIGQIILGGTTLSLYSSNGTSEVYIIPSNLFGGRSLTASLYQDNNNTISMFDSYGQQILNEQMTVGTDIYTSYGTFFDNNIARIDIYSGSSTTTTSTSTTSTTSTSTTSTSTTSTTSTSTTSTTSTTTESFGLLTIDWTDILGSVGIESVLINDTELTLENSTATTYIYRVPQNMFGTNQTIKANLNLSSATNTIKGYDDTDGLVNTLSGVAGSHLYQFAGATINSNKIARVVIEDATPPPTTTTSTSTTTSTTLPEEYGIIIVDWSGGNGSIALNNIYIDNVELTTVLEYSSDYISFMIPSSLLGSYGLKVNITQSSSNVIETLDSNELSLGVQSMGIGSYDYTFTGGTYIEYDGSNYIARVNIYI